MGKVKIYTKTGDAGETSLINGQRVSKTHPRLEVYGNIDELNSVIGIVLSSLPQELDSPLLPLLQNIQHKLFNAGSLFACEEKAVRETLPQITDKDITDLELAMDELEKELPPLKEFILPGGSLTAAQLHLARTVCRRCERSAVRIENNDSPNALLVYINRLSDFLFVASRYANLQLGHHETTWKK